MNGLLNLAMDWRNFQEIAASKDPKYVENLFQQFYNEVFIELDRIFPEGNYYADWTADELFIIFYGEEEEKEIVKTEALKYDGKKKFMDGCYGAYKAAKKRVIIPVSVTRIKFR